MLYLSCFVTGYFFIPREEDEDSFLTNSVLFFFLSGNSLRFLTTSLPLFSLNVVVGNEGEEPFD